MFIGAMFTMGSRNPQAIVTRQMFLRGRVLAQGFTLGAMFHSLYRRRKPRIPKTEEKM